MKVYELMEKLRHAPAGADVRIMSPFREGKDRVTHYVGYVEISEDNDPDMITAIYTGDKDE